MSKRRLSQQQTRRIQQRQTQQATAPQGDESGALGPLQEGCVVSQFRHQADVMCPHTGHTLRCHLRANLGALVAGDKVLWRPSPTGGVVETLLPRHSCLTRPDGFGHLKLMAANVTTALIVVAPQPEAHAHLIDRYVVMLEHFGVTPVLVVNKSDLLTPGHSLHALLAIYETLGYSAWCVSAQIAASLHPLQAYLKGKMSVVVGQSGVGKSSLLQALLPHEQIKIGALSEAVQKGRHTTTYAKVYPFEQGGFCIDSPGIRELNLNHLNKTEVAQGFIEFRPFLGNCKFRNCQHQQEPGCSLLAAVQAGHISQARFSSYLHILAGAGE